MKKTVDTLSGVDGYRVSPSTLERRMTSMDGTVLCHCDGTSRAVRSCMATLIDLNHLSREDDSRAHYEFSGACVSLGLDRLEKLANEKVSFSNGGGKGSTKRI